MINLALTKGAIGDSENFFLDTTGDKNEVFKFYTAPGVNDQSPNLIYGLTFSLNVDGHKRYCRVDPLIVTSTEDAPSIETS